MANAVGHVMKCFPAMSKEERKYLREPRRPKRKYVVPGRLRHDWSIQRGKEKVCGRCCAVYGGRGVHELGVL